MNMKEVKKTAADKIAAEEIEVKKTVRKTARKVKEAAEAAAQSDAVVAEEIEAVNKDKSMELQNWWKSSSNSDSGEDVDVVFNTITLVYDYAGEEMPTDPQTETETQKETQIVNLQQVKQMKIQIQKLIQ